MSSIRTFSHDDKIIKSTDRDVISYYLNSRYAAVKDLELSQIILCNLERIWSPETYNSFRSFVSEIQDYNEHNKLLTEYAKKYGPDSVLIRQLQPSSESKRKEIEIKIINEINGFLDKNHINTINNFFDDEEKLSLYCDFFVNNIWFEIFIHSIFDRVSIRDKEIIFSCDTVGKSGFKHQIDLLMISPSEITIIEAKSRKFKRAELMNLIGKKSDINADIAILICAESYSEGNSFHDYYRNLFVIDKVFDMPLEKIFEKIGSFYSISLPMSL